MKINWKLISGTFCAVLSYSYWYASKIIYENFSLCEGGFAVGACQTASFFNIS